MSWWRRIDWTQIGTVAAVIAGIGTLLFTGVSTFYGALVAQDQLKQSKLDAKQSAEDAKQLAEDAERENRSQAIRVSYWSEGHGDSGPTPFHVVNRSPDPVWGVILTLKLYYGASPDGRTLTLVLGDMKPCSESVIESSNISWQKSESEPFRRIAPEQELGLVSISFLDRQSVRWVRDSRGRLSRFFKTPRLDDEQREININAKILGELPMASAKECGDTY
ncbi:hypothetical protein [Streptomyces europaeiscabiei]|uniref:Secreted protein n=1 Tax=Streptomyces europaeiscabiei TaxID=146819 RepID=A0ABU4NXL2_9ACTN|nr:hypothetical protein [Streptomyces europaeiscabiei]MDX2774625.1 hypothetical protein [Streptomyces europaeiscabiei]MDX3550121.1 hypothetical protein [Streptomyces europaeiscabiei]MDX3559282.1 hypothetical protein [Streptomyces europaeiscabiei]MDX3673407.1 hypothetical protein [Streptomyces europaeiscabiei]MDX3707295.1 hypothetical protein [Streptomyces europaeiscabiei]